MLVSNYLDQIKELLTSSQKVLVITKKSPSLDILTSAWLLERQLKKQGKEAALLIEDFEAEALPLYFDGLDVISKLPPKSLIVSINLHNSPIEKVNYQTVDGRLDLVITPKSGEITAEAIEFKKTNLEYDLIFILGAKDLSETGSISIEHAEGLANLASVNIDIDKQNSLFGKINLVDEESISLSQAVFSLGKLLGFSYDKMEATAFYFALVDKTQSFRENVSVSVFKMAAELMELGAEPGNQSTTTREATKEEVEMR